MKEEILVGCIYLCSKKSDSCVLKLPGKVVKKRQVTGGEEDDEKKHFEYYVHYVDLDRRLDEWVSQDRIGEEVVPVKAGEKRKYNELKSSQKSEDHDSQSLVTKKARSDHARFHELTKVRNINRVQLGQHEIDCWYYSPYPENFGNVDKLYICESSFKYFATAQDFADYIDEYYNGGKAPTPPGRCIYRDRERKLVVHEIDGEKETLYGQNLCLFGKLFIEHKTLSFDPAPFFFYVLFEEDDEDGSLHPVGYFSKEKDSKEKYNLACIVTLPPFQRKGYGKFIISLSYEITKRHHEVGSPEKPLSDLGKLSYRSYWKYVLLDLMSSKSDEELTCMTFEGLSLATGIKPEDILSTMQSLGMVYNLKGQFVIRIVQPEVEAMIEPYKSRKFASVFSNPKLLEI